jgi:hypothetical protein
MPIKPEFAAAFAKEWVAGANARDFDKVLAYYAEDVIATSPYIRIVTGEPSGKLVGKDKLRGYWTGTLTKRPELEFDLIEAFIGAESVTIHYLNRGQRAIEVFFFDERGKIVRSDAHYLPADAPAAPSA